MIFKQDLWLNPGVSHMWWTLVVLHYSTTGCTYIFVLFSFLLCLKHYFHAFEALWFLFYFFSSGMGWFELFEVTSSLEDIDVTWKPMMIVLWRQMLWTGSISIWRTTQTLALMCQGNVTQVKVLSAGSFGCDSHQLAMTKDP